MTDGRSSTVRALVRGACPDVAMPMDALDGPLLRVTIPGGIISGGQARVLAEVAERLGNSIIEITNRANVQVRGVTDGCTAAQVLVAADLASGVPGGDRARAILASPTAGVDAQEHYDTRPIVRRLVAELAARVDGHRGGSADDEAAAGLGPKFSVLVDGGGAVHVRDRRATQRLVPEGLGTDPCPPPIGVVAARQAGQVWVGAAPVLGRINPDVLFGLADLAVRFGDGDLRLTPWKGVIVAGVDASRAGQLVAELSRLELSVDPADPVSRVVACAGSTGCEQGLADVQTMARGLISRARAGDVQLIPSPGVHLSGCEKCCASRDPALVTWIATKNGMVMRERTARGDGVRGSAGAGADAGADAGGRGR